MFTLLRAFLVMLLTLLQLIFLTLSTYHSTVINNLRVSSMGGGDRCSVGGCNNDRRFPHRNVIRGHVSELKFHSLPKDPNLRQIWHMKIKQGRDDYVPAENVKVCSNHFEDGERTSRCQVPTLFLNKSDLLVHRSPVKRKSRVVHETPLSKALAPSNKDDSEPSSESTSEINDTPFCISFASTQLTRDADVHFYAGLPSCLVFKLIFEHLSIKARTMQYWRGEKQTEKETPSRYKSECCSSSAYGRPGPSGKLSLEQKIFLVLMRLRLSLLVHDLAFRFQVSDTLVSSIFITWIRLMRLELSHLIVWPSKEVIKANLPECFRLYYPKVRCIIDCTEVFIETPSSLDTQAQCWSDYKHHCTIKFLVAITPNGLISYVSPCYGGRASDKFITRDCSFLNLLEPYDQIMADRGFKIREDLMSVQATLAIPPSTMGSLQMPGSHVIETSRIANVRIYVEQAIGRVKNFRFLKNEIPISCLSVVDDIVIVACALSNLLDPLC